MYLIFPKHQVVSSSLIKLHYDYTKSNMHQVVHPP